jgi:hypothetical protein
MEILNFGMRKSIIETGLPFPRLQGKKKVGD